MRAGVAATAATAGLPRSHPQRSVGGPTFGLASRLTREVEALCPWRFQ
jgi:hypothetical protein